jgi:hypothetical protein
MYGAFGFYGDFGAASSDDYKAKIEAQKKKIADLRKKVWKEKVFTYGRKQAELAVQKAVVDLRVLRSKYRKAKRDEVTSKSKGSTKTSTKTSTSTSTSTAELEVLVRQLIEQMKAQGIDEDTAEEAAKERVLPQALRARFPRGYFRGLVRRGPRPAPPRSIDPIVPGRSIDPFVPGRSIDPRIQQFSVDPRIAQRSLDPFVPGTELNIQSGAFMFPPGNLTDDADFDDEETDLAGLIDTVKGYAQKPLVLAGIGLAALIFGRRFLRKSKAKGYKTNPSRRRRRARKNRR